MNKLMIERLYDYGDMNVVKERLTENWIKGNSFSIRSQVTYVFTTVNIDVHLEIL